MKGENVNKQLFLSDKFKGMIQNIIIMNLKCQNWIYSCVAAVKTYWKLNFAYFFLAAGKFYFYILLFVLFERIGWLSFSSGRHSGHFGLSLTITQVIMVKWCTKPEVKLGWMLYLLHTSLNFPRWFWTSFTFELPKSSFNSNF